MRPMVALATASGYSSPSDGHNYSVRRAVDFGRVASAARCSANASALLLQLLSAASLLPAPAERGADSGTQEREMRHLACAGQSVRLPGRVEATLRHLSA